MGRHAVYSLSEQLFATCRLRRFRVIWTPHYNAPWLTGIRRVTTVHDVAHLALPNIFGRGVKRTYARWSLGCVARNAHTVIFVSAFTQMDFSRLTGQAPLHSIVIPNGVGETWFDQTWTGRGGYYLFVGNVKPHKNLRRLIGALDRVRKQRDISLVVVGKREGFISGETGGWPDWVRFTGEISDEHLKQHYREARALIFPSIYEGFGLPALEAMAAGCPLLASRIGAITEVCARGHCENDSAGNVIYFDPLSETALAEAIIANEAMPEDEVDAMRKRAQERAHEFTWDASARQTWKVLAETMG